jgi:hypothetical protein
LCLPSGLLPSGSPPKPCICLYSPPYMLHAPPTSFFLIWLPLQKCKIEVLIYLFIYLLIYWCIWVGASRPRCTWALLKQALCAPYQITGALWLYQSSRRPPCLYS